MGQNEAIEKAEKILAESGVDISTFLDYCVTKDKSFLKMPDTIKEQFYDSFDKLKSNYNTTKEKGDALERLAGYLTYSEGNLFDLKNNIRTSSNEIDLFLTPSDKGKIVFNNYYKFIGDGLLCECKNYSDNLGVTYVGKFFSLLCLSGFKIGIIFTLKGVTGKHEWTDSKGLIRKIALKEDMYILDFTLEDYKKIKENDVLFLDMVERKYIALKNDISYAEYISQHEAEEEYKRQKGIQ